MNDLSSTVALVAGASRGVGKGVALALGEAGATVLVTGRTLKSARRRDRPGSIDETASQVSRRGGRGDAVQCDHTRVEDVRALVDAVGQRHGRLDTLVLAVGDAAASAAPFWEQPLALWDATQRRSVWSALLTARFAAPLLTASQGVAVIVAPPAPAGGADSLYPDLARASLAALAAGMARDWRPHGVTSVALDPGVVRTERALAAAGVTERTWRRTPDLAASVSPLFVGRGVAGLVADPARFALTGESLSATDLAARYGVADEA